VSDTGIGIAEEDLPMVMAPFGQADAAFDREHAGTGLGLPLATQLAKLHGAELSIDSRVGEGTTVRVAFPAERCGRQVQCGLDLTAGEVARAS
jgi:two-component system cell cycle sensor histidine kinase PleC